MKRVGKVLGAGAAILVVGIATFAAYSFYLERDQMYRSRLFRAKSDINAIESAVDKFRATNGRLPAGFDDLIAGHLWPTTTVPMDPWNAPYSYQANSDGSSYTITGKLDPHTQQRTGLTEVSNLTDWDVLLRR